MSFDRTAEWNVWANIKQRCFNNKHPSYPRYGGRGITMYEPWIHNFKAFHQYIGDKPSPELSIERIDNDGNYEPGNIKWATRKEQNRNKTHKGGGKRMSNAERYRVYYNGLSGISYRHSCVNDNKRWLVTLMIDGKRKSMGLYKTREEAKMALRNYASVYFGDKL